MFTHENWRRRYAGAGCFSLLMKLVALWVYCVSHIIYILCSDWLSDVTTVPNIVSIYCSTVCLPYAHNCLIINFVFWCFYFEKWWRRLIDWWTCSHVGWKSKYYKWSLWWELFQDILVLCWKCLAIFRRWTADCISVDGRSAVTEQTLEITREKRREVDRKQEGEGSFLTFQWDGHSQTRHRCYVWEAAELCRQC